MNENNKKDNFYSVETILKNKIAPELYSHYDELASVKFVVTINETEKKLILILKTKFMH